jgi:hypothetical protein
MPVAMAARGMPSNFADSGDCAMVMPPLALTSRMPMAPSDAVPDSTIATARSRATSASELKNPSIGVSPVRSPGRGDSCSVSPDSAICMFGGIT